MLFELLYVDVRESVKIDDFKFRVAGLENNRDRGVWNCSLKKYFGNEEEKICIRERQIIISKQCR